MNRKEQIKEAARQRADQYDHPSKWSDTYYGFIDGAKWADQHPQWIPVEEELPPHDPKYEGRKSVDCYITDGVDVEISYYNYYNNTWDDVRLSGKVTHWYIPQPPQGKEE